MTTRAVIFDLFGTLVRQFPGAAFRRSLARMGEALGLSADTMHDLWTGKETYIRRHKGGSPTLADELRATCAAVGVTPTDEGVDEALRVRYEFTRATLVPRDDAVATLQQLRKMGLRVGLISDCSQDVPELWRKTPFVPLFDVTVFSCDVHMKKPEPQIYQHACKTLGVEPPSCIYVGDGCSNELTGARAVGMRPFLLYPPDEERPKSYDWEGDGWDGETIAALGDVLTFATD